MHEEEHRQPATVFAAIAGSLEKNLPGHLAKDVCGQLTTVYACAVAHALRDLELVSGIGSFNEEDRTASLIGHLGSHLSWYLAMSDLSGINEEQPSVSWSYQSKKSEAEKGGDFGLAVRLSKDEYNIAFFQAKNADLSPGKAVNLWRPPYGYRSTNGKFTQAQADSAGDSADRELLNAIRGRQLSAKCGKGQHQFVKLALLASRATKNAAPGGNWIHYVLWPEHQSWAPITFNFPRLQEILTAPDAEPRNPLKVPAAYCEGADTFAALLMRGGHRDADGWLTVKTKEAKELIGALTELCNRWMIVEDSKSGGGLANALKGQDAEVVEQHPPLKEIQPLQLQSTPNPTLNSIFGLK